MIVPGQFITVGDSPGIVVDPTGLDVPEDHVAIWYGQFAEDGRPRVRTVPKPYVVPAKGKPDVYH
jgi:hypothetical protein